MTFVMITAIQQNIIDTFAVSIHLVIPSTICSALTENKKDNQVTDGYIQHVDQPTSCVEATNKRSDCNSFGNANPITSYIVPCELTSWCLIFF